MRLPVRGLLVSQEVVKEVSERLVIWTDLGVLSSEAWSLKEFWRLTR